MNIANDIHDAINSQMALRAAIEQKVKELEETVNRKDMMINKLSEELKTTKIELEKLKEVKA